MFFHELETERLLLKNISCEDRDFIFRQFSDPNVTQYLLDAEPYGSVKEADEIIEFYTVPEPRGQHRWILVQKKTGEKIGTCGFHRWDLEKRSTEIGYDLQEKYWGQGLMSEALAAILSFAKEEMNVKTIDAHIYPKNYNSVKLVKKYGFVLSPEKTVYTFRNVDYMHDIYSLKYTDMFN